MRTCYKCKQSKPLDQFVKRKNRPDGRGYQCAECNRADLRKWRKKNPKKHQAQVLDWRRRNPEKVAVYARVWRANLTPEERHANSLKANHNMTTSEYNAINAAQGGKCAICRRFPKNKLYVDHCHDSGRKRGLLCNACNTAIGNLQHDITILQAAIDYLTQR